MLTKEQKARIFAADNVYLLGGTLQVEALYSYCSFFLGIERKKIKVADDEAARLFGPSLGDPCVASPNDVAIGYSADSPPPDSQRIDIDNEMFSSMLKEYSEKLLGQLKNSTQNSYIIYGAGDYASQLLKYLQTYGKRDIIACVVITGKPKKSKLLGLPVYSISDLPAEYRDKPVILATGPKFHLDIHEELLKHGIQSIYPMFTDTYNINIGITFPFLVPRYEIDAMGNSLYLCDPYEENEKIQRIRHYRFFNQPGQWSRYLNEIDLSKSYESVFGPYTLLCNLEADNESALREGLPKVFMAINEQDAAFYYKYDPSPLLTPIQTGALAAKNKLTDVTDDTLDNRSGKNPKYGEVSALYWIWKNVNEPYIGLCHYRRRFVLKREDYIKFMALDLDLLVSTPTVFVPDNWTQFDAYGFLSEKHLITLQGVIESVQPSYRASFEAVTHNCVFHACNMFIGKREWLDKYCSWLFPILDAAEEICVAQGIESQRYLGYMAEILLSVYICKNKDTAKMAMVDHQFLV